MGFMDKAKKLAEQAQEKLDDAQKQFNQGQGGASGGGEGTRYDKHGQPIPAGPPAGEAPPPSAQPPEGGQPAEPEGAQPTEAAEPAPPPPPKGDNESNPDPFKPIQ